MGHVVLLGDSILDNAWYVPDRPPVIDLRLVCDQEADYSPLSPIEPSVTGGSKIARVIAELATTRDFERGRSAIYR